MSAITKERIELFIKNPLDNGLTRGEQMELARIALASLTAEPVVYMWDSERKDIDAPGYYRTEHLVFAESSVKQWGGRVVPLYTAQPVPVTPDGWISCSERMPNDAQWCVVNTEYGYYVQCRSEGQGWLGDDISIPECDVINWMPLPEPPQEVK
ncbi:TPA: DUF551 domain-containing protein [Escherichia coli]|nr:DUF551 domain-containing protein [Escherichia coli]